ncbi:hypothetical protein Tco_0978379 [Tanacetum coccineum]|uniref:Uncharacterized protein n=1 Tax=Tanacetum coccineum TaxID=301880 RepID=A0ABQ5EN83_9ASTR
MFALESNQQISVAAKLAASLEVLLRRPVRGELEQQQFSELSSIIHSVSYFLFDRWCEEDVHHVFFRCSFTAVLQRVVPMWDLDWQDWSSFSKWYSGFLLYLSSKVKSY